MKNIFFLLISMFFVVSCNKNEFDINNLNGNKVSAIGHGGMGIGHSYPMNSFEGILNSLSIGADGVEIDIQMTKDGILVAFHDGKLEESTNRSGKIYDKTWAEIEGARFSYPHYGNHKIIRLNDIFQNIPDREKYTYFLDIKSFKPNKDSLYFETLNNAIIDIIDRYELVEQVYVEFKNEKSISELKLIRPDIKQFIYNDFDYALSLAEQYNLQGITIAIDKLTHEKVKLAHSKNIMVATFNTHSHQRNIDAVKYNVDYNHTDRLKHLLKILKD